MVGTMSKAEALLLAQDDGRQWELIAGELRERPPVSMRHEASIIRLRRQLDGLLDPERFWVASQGAQLILDADNYVIPDVMIIPAEHFTEALSVVPSPLAAFVEAMPLVVEVWSPSTGERDRHAKLTGYRTRGDQEIWLINPNSHTLEIWRQTTDGAYAHERRTEGMVTLHALPDVIVDLDRVFV